MKNKIIIIVLATVMIFSGCIPSAFLKGVDFDNYPERDLPIYDDAIVYEYEDDDEEVTIMYGTEDDVDDVIEFYQDYFEDEGIVLDQEDEEDDEYSALGFYEDFIFEIEVGEAKGDNEEKAFSTVVEVKIEFLSDEEIEQRQGGNFKKDMLGLWEIISIEYDGTVEDLSGFGFAMEFLSDGTMDMYIFYSNDDMTGNEWSVTDGGILTYVDPTLDSKTTGTVSFENKDGKTFMYISGDEGDFTLVKVDKDEFLSNSLFDDDIWEEADNETDVNVPAVGEQLLFNQEGISVTLIGFEESYYSLNMKLLIDNATDAEIYIDLIKIVVNGYSMQEAYVYGSVDPQAKLNTEISFDLDELQRCGIEEIVDVELAFEITDYETWDTIAVSDDIMINTGSNFYQTYDKSGVTLVNEKGVKIIYKSYVTDDEYYGPYVILYVENNGNQTFNLSCDDVKVNGFMMSAWFYGKVHPGTCAIMTLDFYQSDLDDNGIIEVEDVQLTFAASYPDAWDYFLETDLINLPIGQ